MAKCLGQDVQGRVGGVEPLWVVEGTLCTGSA